MPGRGHATLGLRARAGALALLAAAAVLVAAAPLAAGSAEPVLGGVERRAVQDLSQCVKGATLEQMVVSVKTELQQTIDAVVVPLIKASCLDRGLGFDSANKKCLLPPLGLSRQAPAASCKQLLTVPHGRTSGTFFIQLANGDVEQLYCDQTRNGGGWELMMKMGQGQGFEYDSPHWTAPTTLSTFSRELTSNVDAKWPSFNHGVYAELIAYFTDASFTWAWRIHPGGQTALQFFQTTRTLSQTANVSPEFLAAAGRFSQQFGVRRYATNTCATNGRCVRWGFIWNNENSLSSVDAAGGIGMRYSNRDYSAGDVYSCCGRAGANRPFTAQILGRAA